MRLQQGWAWLLGLASLWMGGVPGALAQELPAMQAKQVSASAWYVQGLAEVGSSSNANFISNAGFVVTAQGVVVIDALGSPALAQRLLALIRQVTPLPVTHLIVTHYHPDHIYGLQVFQAAGVRILAHRKALDYLNSEQARQRLTISRQELAPWVDASTQMVAADEWLASALTLNLGGMEFQILPAGHAHTPEDLLVFLPQEKVLFAGDLVFRGRLPFVGQADSGHWIRALDNLQAMDVSVLVPGHGPASNSASQDLQLTRSYLRHLRSAMGQAARNLEPFEAAYAAADWSLFAHLPLFQLTNRLNAYNTYLLMEREGN